MPELPEVQAHAERLEADFGAAVLERFDPLTFTALKTFSPAPEAAQGTALTRVDRRGKYLRLHFEGATFVVHLMQGGRLRPDPTQAAKPRGGIARWRFSDQRALLLTEAGTERKAGVWVVPPADEQPDPGPDDGPLGHLGPEATQVDATELARLAGEHPMRLHGFLRDQRIIAGLGRRLANEVCHRAKVSPFASTAKLDADQLSAVVDAIAGCVEESLAYERTRPDMSSSKDRPGSVHHREGQPCPVCDDVVRAVEYRAYTVNYCPACQTGGKVLADNTTSRFLK